MIAIAPQPSTVMATTDAGANSGGDAGNATSDEIVVTGKKQGTLDLDRLRRAVAVYTANRSQFAPDSTLYFRVPQGEVATIQLTLRGEAADGAGVDIPVPVASDGRFVLPPIPPGKWELTHNLGKRPARLYVQVLAPGESRTDLSLGDLRLVCRVGWELVKSDYSFVARAAFAALGGCDNGSVAIYFHVPHAIATADISAGARHMRLPLRQNATSFHPPLSDRSWPNTAHILVTYR